MVYLRFCCFGEAWETTVEHRSCCFTCVPVVLGPKGGETMGPRRRGTAFPGVFGVFSGHKEGSGLAGVVLGGLYLIYAVILGLGRDNTVPDVEVAPGGFDRLDAV